MITIAPSETTKFLMKSQVKEIPKKEYIKRTELDFDEMLETEMRLLDVNYIRAMDMFRR